MNLFGWNENVRLNFQEHRDTSVGLYGVHVTLKTEDIVISILNGTNTSLALMKFEVKVILSYYMYSIKSSRKFTLLKHLRQIEALVISLHKQSSQYSRVI